MRSRGEPLLEALAAHVPGALEHAEATGSYAFAAAAELGLDRHRAEVVREAARLHDVGMVYVPVEVVSKPASERDRDDELLLASHRAAGADLARGAGLTEEVCGWIAAPPGAGSLEASIIRAACVCDRALADPAATALDAEQRRGHAVASLRGPSARGLDRRAGRALAAVLERALP